MKVFIFFESRYKGLSSLLKNKTFTQKEMGEITWFMTFIKFLQSKSNTTVIHCSDKTNFKNCLLKYQIYNPFLIMDYITIPKNLELINFDNTYCMCYWGKDETRIKKLGKQNGKFLSLKNILTPFNYYNQNNYLGYNLDILCGELHDKIFNEKYGILWGKDIQYIDVSLVSHLCKMGIRFYSTSKTKLHINGVTNLGIIPQKEWHLLLDNCKFILGSGNPKSGPTILEALYYKTPLFCPSIQVPESCIGSHNIHLINDMNAHDIYDKIDSVEFINDTKTKSLINSSDYNLRVCKIFDLMPNSN
tara:strand:- start:1748 stop:2656 length:909 start_codon:yes stop_codon:yes gene_type:complete